MNDRLGRKSVAFGLVVCLVLINALLYQQVPAHTIHHAHHKAATHASMLCSWMCAAAETLEHADFTFESTLLLVRGAEEAPTHVLQIIFSSRPISRAPPTSFT